MQIKRRLRINSTIAIVAMILTFVVIGISAHRVDRALEASRIADKIITASYERLLLRTDNHQTGSERSTIQLVAKHREVGELLKVAHEKFWKPEDKETINQLLKIHEATGKLSRTIRASREKRGWGHPDSLTESMEGILNNQLNIKVYETILLNTKLQRSGSDALILALRQAGGGIALILVVLSVSAFINASITGRMIATRVDRLNEGAIRIGQGDLSHKIDLTGDDEFAELSYSFNTMTTSLRESNAQLEAEIDERKQVEARLKIINADLTVSRSETVRSLDEAQAARREAEHASAELLRGNQELTVLNRAMVGRELRMIELKEEVNALCVKIGEPPHYPRVREEQVCIREDS